MNWLPYITCKLKKLQSATLPCPVMAFTVLLLALATLVSGLQATDFNKDIDHMLRKMKRSFPINVDLPDHKKILPLGAGTIQLTGGELRGLTNIKREGEVEELDSPTPGVTMLEVILRFSPFQAYYDFAITASLLNLFPMKFMQGDANTKEDYAKVRVTYIFVENRNSYKISNIEFEEFGKFKVPIKGSLADIAIVVNNIADIFNSWVAAEVKRKIVQVIHKGTEEFLSD